MQGKKKVLAVISVLKGGGAERVLALLANELNNQGCEVELLTTSSCKEAVIQPELNSKIPLLILQEMIRDSQFLRLYYRLLRIVSSILCKPFEQFKKTPPVLFSCLSFLAEYHGEIKALKNKLKKEPETTLVVFLQPAIPIALLATRGLPNRVIISERCDPKRLMKSRYGYGFVKKYYERADKVVFQTQQAKEIYPPNISQKGTVICNPIKEGLPEPYRGERNKNITTFCRISKQKNLPMLVEAFALVHKEFPQYRLRIIGQPNNDDDLMALEETKSAIARLGVADAVEFLPFTNNVHQEIIKDAMYVNSSDYEGISNAMLEAMAIGMPVVCTDCPVGGAAAVIEHGVNGLLVEVGNSQMCAQAIKRVIADQELAAQLSQNAQKIREDLSLFRIGMKWMELL